MMSTADQPNRTRQPLILEESEDEPNQFTSSPTDRVVTAIYSPPHILQSDAKHIPMISTQVPIFRGSKGNFHDFELFLLNLV